MRTPLYVTKGYAFEIKVYHEKRWETSATKSTKTGITFMRNLMVLRCFKSITVGDE